MFNEIETRIHNILFFFIFLQENFGIQELTRDSRLIYFIIPIYLY